MPWSIKYPPYQPGGHGKTRDVARREWKKKKKRVYAGTKRETDVSGDGKANTQYSKTVAREEANKQYLEGAEVD